ncbi:MAG: hypothetical protein Q8R45_14345 [Brevundimonas sp.]|uniref:hypothetical protein n=1 Tax=Brevundimonas sp. TaxID=1871086 RepID=UPI002718D81B|nr:hypothetical protein [Brevundimonas sp.]MDO9586934.1 hypothetical protein [Brevundimonas sp.]MDP3658130.1 hypothetical protein [Brevundimonas sp.]MDZ4112378.1 hypothetical protein [Brevundimonas sp.]
MLRTLAVAIMAVACLAAWPGRAEMNNAVFGNTVVSRYSDGGWVKHWFNPDGTYTAQFSDGRRLAARWSVNGERVCLSHMRPNMLIPRFCTDLIEADVGETWQARDPLGRRVQNMLVAGRTP